MDLESNNLVVFFKNLKTMEIKTTIIITQKLYYVYDMVIGKLDTKIYFSIHNIQDIGTGHIIY